MTQALLIGLPTGLVSAVLFASASSGTLLGVMILFFLAPMPLAIAGLGWGSTTGLIAGTTGSAIIFVIANPSAAIFYILAIALPMAASAHLLMLSRQVQSSEPDTTINLEWYPVGRLVAFAALWAAILAAIALLSTATDLETLRQTLREAFDKMLTPGGAGEALTKTPLTEQDKKRFIDLMIATLPGALATLWLLVALLNLWLAGHAARISGRLMRPWPDLAALTLPPQMPLAFAAAIAATFLGGIPGLIATGAAFSIMTAYVLVGLAIAHWITRPMAARAAILTTVYLSLVLLNPFSGLALAIVGIAEPISPLQRRPQPPPTNNEPH